MKKIKYLLLLLLSVIFLSGCDLLFSKFANLGLEFVFEDNIKIAVSEYENYNWNDVIKVKKNDQVIKTNDITVKLVSGEIKPGEVCKHEATYKDGLIPHSEFFYVNITEYKIKEIYKSTPNRKVSIYGTVNLVNECGFILTDATSSIFANYENVKSTISLNDTLKVSGTFTNNNCINLDSYEKIDIEKEKVVPTNIYSDLEMKSFIDSYNNTATFIRLEANIILENNIPVLSVGNYNILIDEKNIEDINELINNANKRVLLSGWVYKKTDSNTVMMAINDIEHIYETSQSGSRPVISTLYNSNYFSYSTTSNVGLLTSYFSVTDDKDKNISISSSSITVDNNNIDNGENIVTLKVTDSDGNVSIGEIIIDINSYDGIETNESISKIDENCMPTNGNINVLVIPVDLSSNPATEQMRSNIQNAFFGSEYNTGWESLKSYYQESSYGKLNISGTVTEWYTPKYSSSHYVNYEDEDNYILGSTKLMVEALQHFKNKYNYADFDSNKDGYIDAVYMIYNNDIGGNQTYEEQDFYWAYTYWDFYAESRSYSDTKGYSYVFMGYDFFEEKLAHSSQYLKLNCETLIHETGHLFNLEDYYDYDDSDPYSNDGGYCGADMMDYNFGDHGPFSKIMLDWVNPTEITKSGIYELPSFTKTGTSFAIGANNSFDSIFDEYYLIDFYTLDGLNDLQCDDFFNTFKNYAGVRVSHINSSLTYEDGYFPTYTYNNTDTKHKLIRMLEADYKGVFDLNKPDNTGATLNDFYQVGSKFGTGFYSNYKSSKDNPLPFTMEVLSINDTYATVKIIFK